MILKKLKREEELDGYYAIVTGEYKEFDERIIEIYRGPWKIEESFKITKSDFKTRPVYLSTKEHIQSHVLTFITGHRKNIRAPNEGKIFC